MTVIKLSSLFFVLCLTACNTAPSAKQATTTLDSTKQQTLLSNAAWVLGSWIYTKENKAIKESWAKVSEVLFEGKGEFIFNGEVVNSEKLELKEENGQVYYCATVPGQNENKTIKFLLTEMDEKTLIFEKNEHDFPKRIHYTKMSTDEIVVELSGEIEGKEAGQIYIFKRT